MFYIVAYIFAVSLLLLFNYCASVRSNRGG